MPSGCLTGDSLMHVVSGSLQDTELMQALLHISECPLCADAAEGLRMWLKEKKSVHITSPEPTTIPNSETAELTTEGVIIDARSDSSSGTQINEFHKRTAVINKRIKQRTHSKSIIEISENKRLPYKPFVWLGVAASIILFIGSIYIVWLQNHFDSQKLAEEQANQNLLSESLNNIDTLKISLPENKTMLSMKTKTENKISVSDLSNESEIISDEERPIEDDTLIAIYEKLVLPAKELGETVEIVEVEESKSVFTIVEQMPSFPGGELALKEFLSKNIKYPQPAIENGIQGVVYVSFIVKLNGNIENIKILRGIGSGCDEEAIRVLKTMPHWSPGKQNGKNVNVNLNLPVYFKLQ